MSGIGDNHKETGRAEPWFNRIKPQNQRVIAKPTSIVLTSTQNLTRKD